MRKIILGILDPAFFLLSGRAAAALGLLLVFGFAQTGSAQTVDQLKLSDNYFVTGDYVVGGVGLRGLGVNGVATGTIHIPDQNSVPATGVPPGADIVAAFLYWETVESSNSGAATGQQGFFNGYAITGSALGNPNAPTSWSNGGCSGSSLGSKTIHAYRADVRPFLNLDANGKIQGNGSYLVKLADSGSNGAGVPFTLGASLVIIYRVESPTVPLNSIVLYEGVVAPSNASPIMSQQIFGFYQPDASPVAKITHIVGNGQPNKSESVSLHNVNLPSLYPGLPPFPGVYNQNTINTLIGGGSWDNPTWSVGSIVNGSVAGFDTSETTMVVPANTSTGCVNWGAVIFSTTVRDTDGDGLLDVWEDNQGYTDAKSGQTVALPGANKLVKDIFVEVDYLSNINDGIAGAYLHSHLPKQAALDMVGNAFAAQNVHVHFDVGNVYQSPLPGGPTANCGTPLIPVACDPYIISNPAGTGGNAISEGLFVCTDTTTLCVFPGGPTIGWKGGYLFVKNTAPNPNSTPPIPLLGNFQPGRKDSYHYVLFGHSLGSPRTYWSATGKAPILTGSGLATLVSIVVSGNVGTVTLSTPQLLLKPGDVACGDANCDRVTVEGALEPQNAALNATYKFLNPSSTFNGITNMFTTMFTIQTPGVADGTYDFFSEPQLGLMYGGPTSTSGHSDIGGGDTAVTFGLWPADDAPGCQADPSVTLAPGQTYCTNQVGTITAQAGTLMHEMGHTLFLTHGGQFFPNGAIQGRQSNNPLGAPSYGLNCNPGFLSAMNYLFQIRGFPESGGIDYSGQTLPNLSETALDESFGIGSDLFAIPTQPAAHFTRWYAPPNALDTQLQNTTGGRFATLHCDGTPIPPNEPPAVRVDGSTFSAPIDWNNNLIVPDLTEPVGWQDVNFNGSTSRSPDAAFPGFNDWANFDLRQIGARWKVFGFSGGGSTGAAGGGSTGAAGGGSTGAAGGGSTGAAGGGSLRDPGSGSTGAAGGGSTGAAGGGSTGAAGGGTEQDVEAACSTADPPRGLMAALGSKSVVLNWTAPDSPCQVQRYDIWRATGLFTTLQSVLANIAQFTNISSKGRQNNGSGAPLTTFTDTTVKNNTTYTYFVTETNTKGAQSRPSDPPAPIFVKF